MKLDSWGKWWSICRSNMVMSVAHFLGQLITVHWTRYIRHRVCQEYCRVATTSGKLGVCNIADDARRRQQRFRRANTDPYAQPQLQLQLQQRHRHIKASVHVRRSTLWQEHCLTSISTSGNSIPFSLTHNTILFNKNVDSRQSLSIYYYFLQKFYFMQHKRKYYYNYYL